jgi:Gluconate 2-dehydrogenase subunit 3
MASQRGERSEEPSARARREAAERERAGVGPREQELQQQVVGVGSHDNPKNEVTRRDMLRITAGTVVAISGVDVLEAAPPKPRFFTPAEFALVDELTELIIPADDHSPGARTARAAWFIDASLAESIEPASKEMWRDGLKRVEALSRELHGAEFMKATRPQREAVLTRMSAHESDPKAPEEPFFAELKGRTVHAYYTSKIGIHDEMQYKGNTLLTDFVGAEPSA